MIEKRYDKKKIHRGDKKLKKPLETSSSMERLIYTSSPFVSFIRIFDKNERKTKKKKIQ